MHFLIIADPVGQLLPKSDSGLSMVREALHRSHDISWATPQDLRLYHNLITIRASRVTECAEGKLPVLDEPKEGLLLRSFDGVWIHKDPPVDVSYLSMCWLLSLEEANVPIINRPSHLLRYHEKLLPYEALRQEVIKEDELIPTYLVTGEEHTLPEDFPEGEVITKPWMGFGGNEVEKWNSLQEAMGSPFAPDHFFTLFQPFLPQVKKTGDRRVLFVEGEYAGDLVRIPQADSIRANLAQGGKAVSQEMTKHEQDLTKRLGVFLKKIGIHLAGADYIDGHLTEINITSPTGFEAIAGLGQTNPRVPYLDLAEKLARERK